MKSILSIILLTALVFSLSTCKPAAPSDIFSAAYAKEKNKNTTAMAQAKTFAAKALALHKKKNFIQAEIEWKNALKLYTDGEMYYRFGDTLFNLSRFEDAVKAYKNAIELNHPEKKFVYYNMACAYSRMKQFNDTAEALKIAIFKGYNYWNQIRNDADLKDFRAQTNIENIINNYQSEASTKIIEKYLDLSYAKNKNLSVNKKAQATALTKTAMELYEQKRYAIALQKQCEALNLYSDGEIYFNLGKILLKIKKYDQAGQSILIAKELGYSNVGEFYYYLAVANTHNNSIGGGLGFKYLELAVKNGYNDFEAMRNDSDLVELCIYSQSMEYQDMIKEMYPNIPSYCFSTEQSFNVNMEGRWYLNYLAPVGPNPTTYLFDSNGIVSRKIIVAPIYTQIDYGTYRLSGSTLEIKYNKQKKINVDSGTQEVKIVDTAESFQILRKNKYALIIKISENNIKALVRILKLKW